MSDVLPDAPITKLRIYCNALYDLMDQESSTVTLSDQTEVKVWKGYVTKACESVGAGEGTYIRVVERLTDLGCIKILEKGRRSYPATVALQYPPTDEVWSKQIDKSLLTKAPEPAMLMAEIEAMRKEGVVGGVNVIKVLKEVAERLEDFERRLAKLENETAGTNS